VSLQKITIIVINYGTTDYIRELIKNFLSSLPRFPKLRIDWVVVNAVKDLESKNGSWQKLMKSEFKNKKANYFHFGEILNRGFADNVNLSFRLFQKKLPHGYRAESTDLILILNPDTSLYWANLEKAVDFMNKCPKAMVAGLALTNPSGQPEKWGHSTTFPSIKLFFGRKRFSEPTFSDQPASVAWVSGGSMLVRNTWWEELSGFDPNFYFYFEDVDFCKRTRDKNQKVYFLPQATVSHRRGGSEISIYRRKKHYYASEAHYFHLYCSPSEYLLLRLLRFPFKVFYFFRCYTAPSFWKGKIKKTGQSLSSEKSQGFPRLRSFLHSFMHVPHLKELWSATIIFNLIILGGAIWAWLYLSSPLILHYNSYLGIDLYGDTISFLLFPLLGLLISLFNFTLGTVLFFSKRYSPFVVLPAGASLVFQLTLLIALLNLLVVNS